MSHQRYANQNQQNRSFKGLDLSGVDFGGAELQGCDFTGATLVGTTFAGARTGQSPQQLQRLILTAIFAPAAIAGLSLLIVQIPVQLLGDRFYQVLDFLLRGLPLYILFIEVFFRDSVTRRFPGTTNFFGVASVAALFQIMLGLTLGLVMISLSSFGEGSGAQGLFLLVLAVISAIVTRRLFKWVTEAIQSAGGTSFRKANLTDADFSQAVIQNTDFCSAILTGACIHGWQIQRHTQFVNVVCEYVYLEPARQKRHPEQGKFRQGEIEDYLIGAQGR